MAKRRTSAAPAAAPHPMAIPPRDGPAFQGENALTDSQAEDQLMALLPGNEPDNSEAEGDQDAIETETLEADDQPQDNLGTEATAFDDDLSPDEAGEETDDDQSLVYEVPWDDGTTRLMTAEEIRGGTLRHDDYTRKQQARAEAERAAQTATEAAAHSKQAYEAKTTALDGVLAELSRFQETGPPPKPTLDLARENGQEWAERKAAYDAYMELKGQADRQVEAERAQQLSDAKRVNAEKLLEAVPEWQDVQVQQRDLADINAMGSKAGYWGQEAFNEGISTTPHWQIELWRDAMFWRRQQARQKGKTNGAAPVTKRVTKIHPTVRSQASQPQSARPRKAAEAAMDRFQKNPGGAGHEDLAIDALLARAESKVGSQRRRG